MTHVLITNDDGIDSPGLWELANTAHSLGLDVTVAAPSIQYSGASASILGAHEDGSIAFTERELPALPGIRCFAVDAAPALVTLVAAHGAFGAPPDLVLSGINRGANVGHIILHSGTVGAALTAGVNHARALAVSLDVGIDPLAEHWGAAAPHVRALVPRLLESAAGTVLNLNVPNTESVTILRDADLATFGIVQTTMTDGRDAEGRGVRLSVAEPPGDQDAGSDAALLAEGFATVTSLHSVSEAPVQGFAPEVNT
ncbi:5'-nucleotidase [Microbacteriaceae bacterium SG_E_30_P1]|uniref:5'-nucleotidase n=1 Tax=Antiquaquibacter oligotrophicus TaxID=2880260 RepID=A0ABT6KKZ1_9MICO|nr:5'/3'-nucleotidase SurE [Antiquaquibacter oligotrophicus]MDH6180665.1 5'-nucleotidase [Antiquaquibacter oligotrophicus]UDF13607.1 5'/3'-nucleotidase SurE [Antiquaquibacter oligotrophicus]